MTDLPALAMVVVGARPNLVKAAPLLAALERQGRLRPWLVHTGQHYDDRLSDIFFKELGIPAPEDNLGVGSGSHGRQAGAVMAGLECLIEERRPGIVVTIGDVNSTMAAAVVAAKAGIPQAHVEAGLRSHDSGMPEEVNRVITDRLADVLFTHSAEAEANLAAEGIARERIHPVGNIMIDTLLRLRPRWQGAARRELGDLPPAYGIVTLHRAANVDDPARLAGTIAALAEVSDGLPLVFPIHPRTRAALSAIPMTSMRLIEPLGYLSFMDLLEHARLVITDSGGIQEESTVLGIPCLTLRDNTERPVTVRLGTNRLVGTDPEAIAPAVRAALCDNQRPAAAPPMWDGRTGERIAAVLQRWLETPLPLRLSE